MPADPERVDLDACVLLAYIGNEDRRADVVQALLHEAQRGEIDVITSVISIAEVAFGAEERDSGITTEGEQAIDQLWTPSSPITLVDVSETLARSARAIIRDARSQRMSGVRSVDALHLASARLHACDRIFTYEDAGRREQWQRLTSIAVDEPFTTRPQLDLDER